MKRILLILSLILIVRLGFSQNLQISGGNNFSAAVCDNQVVYVWGSNTSGQLGVDKTGTPYKVTLSAGPVPVWYDPVTKTGTLPPIRQIDAGSGAHVLGLDCNKNVWAWGENNFGQIGQGGTAAGAGTIPSPVPQRVLRGAQAAKTSSFDPSGLYLHDIFYVSGGNNSSYAIEEGTGKVLAWGQNTNGQLGNGNTITQTTPVYVTKEDGTVLTDIVQIEGGDACAYALDKNGYVWSWGINGGGELGRPTAAGNDPRADRVQLDLNFDGSADTPVRYLTGVTQISGGDTHCLALGPGGTVYSFGGDWGPGQRGTGYDYQYQPFAYQVVAPGNIGTAAAPGYQTGPYLTGAKYVAAGQASSAVVMGDGRVVTFGANGIYGGTCPDPGTTTDNQLGQIVAGTLGNGGLASQVCTNFTRVDIANSAYGAIAPVYVMTNATTYLTGIQTVSDGDAWYYATDASGKAFTWGYNEHGELGLGDLNARNYATPFSLPTGCAFSDPCPQQPDLQASYQTCPGFKDTLDSQVPPIYSSFKYTWYSRPVAGGTWTQVRGNSPLLQGRDTMIVNQLLQYKVTVSDSRSSVPFLCGPCPVLSDSITISPVPNPYTSTGCVDSKSRMAQFQITAPANSKIKWYSSATSTTALNPSDSSAIISKVPFNKTDSLSNGCKRGLWAEDVNSYTGVLRQGSTAAAAPCGGSSTTTTGETGDRSPLMVEVTQNTILSSISFLQPSDPNNPVTGNYTVNIYANDPTKGANCSSCTPANTPSGAPGTLLYTSPAVTFTNPKSGGAKVRGIPVNFTLTGTTAAPKDYWIVILGGPVTAFSCSPAVTQTGVPKPRWTTPDQSSPSKAGFTAVLALHDGNIQQNSHVFNIKFNVGTGYNCSRIFVCADGGTCVLPVEYISFDVTLDGFDALLTWATASERNSAYFIVEKSTDGEHFTAIGKVSAAGNSNIINNYSFKDSHLASGVTYYRLAQYDIDGKVSISELRSVSREGVKEIRIIPNPNAGIFTVSVDGISENFGVKIIVKNSLGQEVYVSPGSVPAISTVNIQALPAGMYYLEAQTEDGTLIAKLIKE